MNGVELLKALQMGQRVYGTLITSSSPLIAPFIYTLF